LSLACGQRHAILDGNVKRVLARCYAVPGWPGRAGALARLWRLAESCTPRERVADYNQAMMDLGATLCTRSRPACQRCPVAWGCQARRRGEPTAYPEPRPRKQLPLRTSRVLLVENASGEILLERRPPSGVWAGLWSLPECPMATDPVDWCRDRLGATVARVEKLRSRRHTFSHFHLEIAPLRVWLQGDPAVVADWAPLIWYDPQRPARVGLAAPVARVLQGIIRTESDEQGANL
jgi:A/G-specific adenine glycosylase